MAGNRFPGRSSATVGSVRRVPLDEYRRMRNFAVTPEPNGGPGVDQRDGSTATHPRFVVQEHHATALHWDFRLERDAVLVS
ncbi:MAG: DNA_ligase_IV_Ku-like [uncultured Acidimicrobiales bacterium]|uniref:DNA_ligase_IV_Ku-like n=1 Tax=uncultured Acidimicrobiales bacterium TaxID=310071 RepID=A0A6J4IPR5_9ACTN|nr:MAG: DNA_ligase_IV_Ku-like [uncultured Acidimicrobiales bacterium]